MSDAPVVLGDELYALRCDVDRDANGDIVWSHDNAKLIAHVCYRLSYTPKQLRVAIQKRPITLADYAKVATFIQANKARLRGFYLLGLPYYRLTTSIHH